MFLKLLLALVAFFLPGNRLHFSPDQEILPYGPQNPDDIARAREALHGDFQNGDMIFSDDYINGAGINDTKYRWPGYPGAGNVPYVIDSSLTLLKPLILKAMDQYHELTCIKFVPRTNEEDYINIVNVTTRGCASYVGKLGSGKQDVYLGRGCEFIGTIVHELGHAIGLYHEHQRSDRDTYIKVYLKNVQKGKERNFNKIPEANELIVTKYDHSSIMHYGNYAFSKSPYSLITMLAKNGDTLLDPYYKAGLTDSDVTTIKELYKCE